MTAIIVLYVLVFMALVGFVVRQQAIQRRAVAAHEQLAAAAMRIATALEGSPARAPGTEDVV